MSFNAIMVLWSNICKPISMSIYMYKLYTDSVYTEYTVLLAIREKGQ